MTADELAASGSQRVVESADEQTHAHVDAMYEKPMSRLQQRNAAQSLAAGLIGEVQRIFPHRDSQHRESTPRHRQSSSAKFPPTIQRTAAALPENGIECRPAKSNITRDSTPQRRNHQVPDQVACAVTSRHAVESGTVPRQNSASCKGGRPPPPVPNRPSVPGWRTPKIARFPTRPKNRHPQRSQIDHTGYKFGLRRHFKRNPEVFCIGHQKSRERSHFRPTPPCQHRQHHQRPHERKERDPSRPQLRHLPVPQKPSRIATVARHALQTSIPRGHLNTENPVPTPTTEPVATAIPLVAAPPTPTASPKQAPEAPSQLPDPDTNQLIERADMPGLSHQEQRPVLLRPATWAPKQLENLTQRARNAVTIITELPRNRVTLIAVLAVILVVVIAFVYLVRRKQQKARIGPHMPTRPRLERRLTSLDTRDQPKVGWIHSQRKRAWEHPQPVSPN